MSFKLSIVVPRPLRLGSVIHSSSFKLAFVFAILFAGSSLLLFSFVYWQTIRVETQRFERELTRELRQIAQVEDAALAQNIQARIDSPAHRLNFAGLFTSTGQPLMGNIPIIPPFPHLFLGKTAVDFVTQTEVMVDHDRVMMVGQVLPDQRILVIGRSEDSVDTLGGVLMQALEQGIVPATILALIMGVVASLQSHARIKTLTHAIERIMQGNLQERLPIARLSGEIDRLAQSVNSMLDEIEQMVEAAKSTGGNIAHDLRTPLTRVRTRLERACQSAKSHDELKEMVEQAIVGLDQALRIITALLRIGKIESAQVHSHFTTLDLCKIIQEIGELFEPVAEQKNIHFIVDARPTSPIVGDWELLNEAIVNLVDNAVKFTPEGGEVHLDVHDRDGVPVVRITDNGPGIHPDETDFVWNRYYRSDQNLHEKGTGLGLSIVRAIVQMHGFSITVENLQPGCRFELVCRNVGQSC